MRAFVVWFTVAAGTAGLVAALAEDVPLVPSNVFSVQALEAADVDGDHDGFADTGETVDLRLTLQNNSDITLHHAVARLVTDDPRIDCMPVPEVSLGTFAPGVPVTPGTAFRLRVSADADRAGAVPPVACVASQCLNGAGTCSK